MRLNLTDTVIAFLQQNSEQKFTAREIADWILEAYPEECRRKQKRSRAKIIPIDSDKALLQQLVAEISANRPIMQKKNESIKTTEGRPRKYYFTEASDSAAVDQAESNAAISALTANNPRGKEYDLYPVLCEFLQSEFEVYSKRIDEKRAGNTRGAGGNKWLYPDIVGIENLSKDWHREIKDCVQQYADKKTKLWSFEVKVLVNRSNVREVFFQAVSNSSWANFGYLVASEVEGVNTLKELRILSGLHGIGFIRLDTENPLESQIMIPAKERSAIDWNTANRLAEENRDFLDYIKSIRQFYQTGEIRQRDWDIPVQED